MRLAPKFMIERHAKLMEDAHTLMECEHHYHRLIEAASHLKVRVEEKIKTQDPESDADKE